MKSFKFILINALTLIIGLGLMSGSVSQRKAQAARFETIPGLSVGGLGNLRGQYLTLLYVIASRPLIATESSQITVTQVKESRTVYIAADQMTLPAVRVEKEGFRPSYNMVLLVTSAQPDFSWTNADGSTPQGSPITANHNFGLMKILGKSDIEKTNGQIPDGASLLVDINSLN